MEDFGIADYFRILSRISASKKVDIGSSPKYGPDHISPDIPDQAPDQAPDLTISKSGVLCGMCGRINGSLILDFIFRISLDHILKTKSFPGLFLSHTLFYFSTVWRRKPQ